MRKNEVKSRQARKVRSAPWAETAVQPLNDGSTFPYPHMSEVANGPLTMPALVQSDQTLELGDGDHVQPTTGPRPVRILEDDECRAPHPESLKSGCVFSGLRGVQLAALALRTQGRA